MDAFKTNITAGILVGALSASAALAQESGDIANDQDGSPENSVQVETQDAEALTAACTFYRNILDLADARHFNGALVDPDHTAMAEASMQEMLRQVFFDQYYDPVSASYDESVITFADENTESIFDDGAEIAALSFTDEDGETVAIAQTEAPETMTSYGDHCGYLQGNVADIAAITGETPLSLYELAVNGALSETRDPHTSYLPPEDSDDMSVQTQGEFGGLGIEINMINGEVTVNSPIDGTPADEAGIMAGDVILGLDGQRFLGMTLRETVDIMRGPVGSDVTLQIRRGEDEFDLPITRGTIQIDAAEAEILESDPSSIRLRVKNFSRPLPQESYERIHEQLASLSEGDTPVENIIIDVRNNPGGLLTAGNVLTDLFLSDDGEGARERIVGVGRDADEEVYYVDESARPQFDFTNYNIIVLQNQGSASASEILAGALQDAGREVVGHRSFGKGSVQTMMPTTASGDLARLRAEIYGRFRLTTGAFFAGDSRLSNQGSGIIPDVQVQFNDVRDELARDARREADLAHSLLPESATREGQIPEHICSLRSAFAGALSDEQVEALPADLVRDLRIRNEETDEMELTRFFDADLHCASMRLGGQSETPYAVMYSRPAQEQAEPPAPKNGPR